MAEAMGQTGTGSTPDAGSPRADTSRAVSLYLALFLALLAFFILLTALSTFDPARTVPVIEAIEARFSTVMGPRSDTPVAAPDVAGPGGETLAEDAAFLQSVSGSFEGLAAEAVPANGLVRGMRFDPAALFVGKSAALNGMARAALEGAAYSMTVPPAGLVRRLDIAVGGQDDLSLRRAAAIASTVSLITGAPKVSVRMIPGREGIELTYFTTRGGGA